MLGFDHDRHPCGIRDFLHGIRNLPREVFLYL